jgi:hypothetical protein
MDPSGYIVGGFLPLLLPTRPYSYFMGMVTFWIRGFPENPLPTRLNLSRYTVSA